MYISAPVADCGTSPALTGMKESNKSAIGKSLFRIDFSAKNRFAFDVFAFRRLWFLVLVCGLNSSRALFL